MGVDILMKLMKFVNYNSTCGFCVVLTAVAFAVAIMNPAIGYELSIYVSTPLAVWVLILFNMAVGVLLLVREASQGKPSNRWWFALGILMANGIVVLLMSVLRDYYTVNRGDALMHIGYVRDLANGIVGIQNIYPGIHAIPALLVLAGLSPSVATNLSPLFCYLIYVSSFYFLARFFWGDRQKVILATCLSAILLLPHAVGLAATFVAATMFPLTLLLLLRMRHDFKIRDIVIYLVFVAAMSVLHPLAFEVVLITLITACFVFSSNRWKLVALTVVVLPVSIWWYGHWYRVDVIPVLFHDVTNSVVTLANTTQSQEMPSTVQESPSSLIPAEESNSLSLLLPSISGIKATQTTADFSTWSLLLRRYGGEMLLGCLAMVTMGLIVKKGMRAIFRDSMVLYFCCLFMVLNLLWVAGWYLQMPVYNASLIRLMYWVTTVSVILTTPLVVMLVGLKKLGKLSLAISVFVLSAIACFSVFNRYPSPIIGVENLQVTYQEMKGMVWLAENVDPSNYVIHLNSQRMSRYMAAIYGATWARENQAYIWLSKYEECKSMFSYNDHLSISEEYPVGFYLVVTKLDRALPRWESDKLYMIESDPAAALIYEDGNEFQVFRVVKSEVQ